MDTLLSVVLFLLAILAFAAILGAIIYVIDKNPGPGPVTPTTTEVQYVLTPSTYGWGYRGWNYGRGRRHRRY